MKKIIGILRKDKIGRLDYIIVLGTFLVLEVVIFSIVFSLVDHISNDTWLPIFGTLLVASLGTLAWINSKRMRDAGRNTKELFYYFVIPLFFAAHSIFLIFLSSKDAHLRQE